MTTRAIEDIGTMELEISGNVKAQACNSERILNAARSSIKQTG
jgi:hypothetical protein